MDPTQRSFSAFFKSEELAVNVGTVVFKNGVYCKIYPHVSQATGDPRNYELLMFEEWLAMTIVHMDIENSGRPIDYCVDMLDQLLQEYPEGEEREALEARWRLSGPQGLAEVWFDLGAKMMQKEVAKARKEAMEKVYQPGRYPGMIHSGAHPAFLDAFEKASRKTAVAESLALGRPMPPDDCRICQINGKDRCPSHGRARF